MEGALVMCNTKVAAFGTYCNLCKHRSTMPYIHVVNRSGFCLDNEAVFAS